MKNKKAFTSWSMEDIKKDLERINKEEKKQEILNKIDSINQELMTLSIMLDNSDLSRSEVREIAKELTDINKDDNLRRI